MRYSLHSCLHLNLVAVDSISIPKVLQLVTNMNVTMSAKVAHELFVTGHSGGAVTEIMAVAAVAPVGVFIRNVASDLLLTKPCDKRFEIAHC